MAATRSQMDEFCVFGTPSNVTAWRGERAPSARVLAQLRAGLD